MRIRLPARALVAVFVAVATLGMIAAPALAEHETTASWPFTRLAVPAERPRGHGVRVAVVDSGIDRHHPAFAGRVVEAVDCVGSGGDAKRCRTGGNDENGHGTHIAGIIAARAIDRGPEGIAPEAQLLAIRALTNACDAADSCRALGELSDVVAAVRWASDHDADLINLSIDAGVDLDWRDGPLADAISDAWRRGAVIVASTGNRGATVDDRALRRVPLLLVGATDASGAEAAYSNTPRAARWALLAPGGEAGGDCPAAAIESTYPRELAAAGTGCLAGTSMAAAYVTGALASLMSSGLDGPTALAHLLATARSDHDAAGTQTAAADLGTALDEAPRASAGAELVEAVARDRRDLATSAGGPANEWSVGEVAARWADAHPLRTRALGILAMLCGLLFLVRGRRADQLLRL